MGVSPRRSPYEHLLKAVSESIEVARRDRVAGAIHTFARSDALARRLRRSLTYTEKRLWAALRRLALRNTHFRKQAPFGPYVVDFVCHRSRLIVEVDGGVHQLPQVAAADVQRDAWLTGRGYRVLRFTNRQVEDDLERVVEVIIGALGVDTPTPGPSPQGGGEQR